MQKKERSQQRADEDERAEPISHLAIFINHDSDTSVHAPREDAPWNEKKRGLFVFRRFICKNKMKDAPHELRFRQIWWRFSAFRNCCDEMEKNKCRLKLVKRLGPNQRWPLLWAKHFYKWKYTVAEDVVMVPHDIRETCHVTLTRGFHFLNLCCIYLQESLHKPRYIKKTESWNYESIRSMMQHLSNV